MNNFYYRRLQAVMALMGIYDGKCDGVWGQKTIAAKVAWENMDSFEPAVPSNGMPFAPQTKLPSSLYWASRCKDLFKSTEFTEAQIEELLSDERHQPFRISHLKQPETVSGKENKSTPTDEEPASAKVEYNPLPEGFEPEGTSCPAGEEGVPGVAGSNEIEPEPKPEPKPEPEQEPKPKAQKRDPWTKHRKR